MRNLTLTLVRAIATTGNGKTPHRREFYLFKSINQLFLIEKAIKDVDWCCVDRFSHEQK